MGELWAFKRSCTMMIHIELGLCLLFLLIWTPSNSALLCLTPGVCNDGNPCTKDDCTLLGVTILCSYQNQPQGFICSDGNYCNGLEVIDHNVHQKLNIL